MMWVLYDPKWSKQTRRWRWLRGRLCRVLGHEETFDDLTPWLCRWCGIKMPGPQSGA